MPQVPQVSRTHKNRPLVWTGVITLIVVACVGSYLYWLFVPPVATVVNRADNLNSQGNYTQALRLLQGLSPRVINKSDEEDYLAGLATTYYNLGKYDQAVSNYLKLDNLQPRQQTTITELAQAAQMANNNDVELRADKELLPIMEASESGPTRQNDIDNLQAQIAGLEK